MPRKIVFLLSTGLLALADSSALAQTAVERNLPPAPQTGVAPVEVRDATPASEDATPLGANLKAIVLLDAQEAAVDAAAIAPGVHAARLGQLDGGRLRRRLGRFLGQPLSRRLIAQIQAEVARAARTAGRPFVSLSTPEQEITSGVLQLRVTEFRVGSVSVQGTDGRDAAALKRQVRVVPGQPVDSRVLAEDLDWINRNPFQTVGAQFAPATQAGNTDLTLAAERTRPFRLYGGWSNTGSQSTGIDRFFVGGLVKLPVLTGAYASYQLTGSRDFWVRGGDIFPRDPRYVAQGGRIYIPTAPRQNIEITISDALTNQVVNADFTVRQRTTEATAAYRTALSNLGLPTGYGDLLIGVEGKRQHRTVFFGSQTALDVSADIWQGLIGWSKGWLGNGRQASAALNLHVSPGGLTDRSSSARLSDITNGRSASAKYAYATLDLTGQTRLPHNFALTSSLSVQYAAKAVPLSAQIGLGGDGLVRGYTSDDGSFDAGAVIRNEVRMPPLQLLGHNRDQLSPYLFVDAGYGRDRALHSDETVVSAGAGTDYRIGSHFSAGVNAGLALTDGQRTRSGNARVQARATISF
ncbi:ShlB/FhaC/HecB family hemolysin secretion/activation protein [uncultured Sphingomonas sp.]|uniref:ShlB/FhaC/HecB family hemolysin secretion/activation protein n=1 Tax=uncultured Sphingomonas sp. TaxID=158754 RepID=UPI0025FCB0FD|nr:ShlB/FhaC/HecB family hemolysin secretion/activation protein [uncultured Sphingomonas sp.]